MPDYDLHQHQQPEQLDLIGVRDALQEGNRLLRKCAADLGDRYLADLIEQSASTVHNQLSGSDPNKRPSFDLAIALAKSHAPFRKALCLLLCPPPSLDPSEGIAEIERDILPELGAADSKKLRSILRRIRK